MTGIVCLSCFVWRREWATVVFVSRRSGGYWQQYIQAVYYGRLRIDGNYGRGSFE